MKMKFRDINLRRDSLQRIDICNQIINEYLQAGMKLTLRQLYYQLVTKNIITNEEKSYSHLSTLISNGRLAGLIDWEAIEDRVRRPHNVAEFQNLQELINAALYSYRLPRWKGQDKYVELWVEKDALAGVLQPLAKQYHVTLMVNRGYSSQTAMYEAAERFIDAGKDNKVLFYLGDFDPSGEDMVRDIRDRMEMFGVYDLQVVKLALTLEQVREYNPPPNPAKITDPRARDYIERYGEHSWEVDALPPKVLGLIIKTAFEAVVDKETMEEIISKEEVDKEKLRRWVRRNSKVED